MRPGDRILVEDEIKRCLWRLELTLTLGSLGHPATPFPVQSHPQSAVRLKISSCHCASGETEGKVGKVLAEAHGICWN